MSAASLKPARGSRFPTLEKYDVLEELGHGGMATVYRARDVRLGRDVAVKVIHPHLRDSAEAVRRFSIEARAVAKLRHPSIVEVYDVSAPTDDEQYLVVELLRGVTLRKLIELHGALPAEVAASIAVELLGALAHAHEAGVIHRDVKPENVILEHRPATPKTPSPGEVAPPETPSATSLVAPKPSNPTDTVGDRIAVKLTDFGIAKLLDAQGVTSTGQVLGSPAHMAPEQIEGREVDGRADVFGMGVLLYECMVGHLPFQGANPAQVLRRVLEGEYPTAEHERPTIGRTWSAVLDRALAPVVEARFASATEMRDALVRELARLGVASARGEIEAWLDDPAGFASAHQASMAGQLCARAEEASRRGEALVAAADYNRALAYAPHDAALLKLVSRMNRRSARQDVLRRAWPYAAAFVVVAGGGVGVRYRLAKASYDDHPEYLTPMATASTPVPAASPVLSSTVVAQPQPEAVPTARTLAHPSVSTHGSASTKASVREIRVTNVEPPEGVRVSIDGAPAGPLDVTQPLALDNRPHSLSFSCIKNLCDTFTRAIEAGDRPVSFPVRMTIKPSRLVIKNANPAMHYLLTDDNQTLQGGEATNLIAMPSATRIVRVKELETGRSERVELHATEMSPVSFGAEPGHATP